MNLQSMYQAWCDGQSYSDVRTRYKEFISLASRIHNCPEQEIENFLKAQTWFNHTNRYTHMETTCNRN